MRQSHAPPRGFPHTGFIHSHDAGVRPGKPERARRHNPRRCPIDSFSSNLLTSGRCSAHHVHMAYTQFMTEDEIPAARASIAEMWIADPEWTADLLDVDVENVLHLDDEEVAEALGYVLVSDDEDEENAARGRWRGYW